MDPAKGMIADPELAGIVGEDDHVAHQPMMANTPTEACFGQDTGPLAVKNVDTPARQLFHIRHLVTKVPRRDAAQFGSKRWVNTAVFQIAERSIVEDIVLVIATQ